MSEVRLIDATALKKLLVSTYYCTDRANPPILDYILEDIDNAQTVEAYPFEQVQELIKLNQQFAQEIERLKRPQGEWIPQGGGFSWVFKCSCCGWVDGYPFNKRHKYCPNCGSEMKGGAE